MIERYGKYIVLDDSGDGGQSEVLKVRHKEYGNIRALSVTYFKENEDVEQQWKKFKERCGRLLRLCNGNHPNIVHCFYPEKFKNEAFFEMDYINGDNLFQYLEKHNHFLPIEEILNMTVQMSDALSYCHFGTYEFSVDPDTDIDPDTGKPLVQADINDNKIFVPVNQEDALKKLVENHQVVHNDISSKNIMRSSNGTYVLIDFGLSVEGNEVVDPDSIRVKEGHREYMAPERWGGAMPTPQSDIYSFGIVLFEYLTGYVPFKLVKDPFLDYSKLKDDHSTKQVPNIIEMRKKAYEQKKPGEKYKREKERELDWLEEIVYKCLEKDPNKRFQDGKELHEFIMSHLNKDTSVYKEEELRRLNEEVRDLEKYKKANETMRRENLRIIEEKKLLDSKIIEFGICLHCGRKDNYPGAKYCRYCGHEF